MNANSIDELKLSAEQGDFAAQFNLGTFYLKNANGSNPDFEQAAKWYLRAAEQGNMNAQFEIGLMYFHGRGMPENYVEAEKWYRKAEAQGLKQATTARENLEYTIKAVTKDIADKSSKGVIKYEGYKKFGLITGSLMAVIIFIGSWIYCIAAYGFLIGVGVGWLPSVIAAAIGGVIAGCLWPLTIICAIGLIGLLTGTLSF